MAVEVNRPLVLQHFDDRFQRQIAVGGRRFRIFFERLAMSVPLSLILAGLDKLFALKGGDLHARRRRHLAALEVEAFGILAVGHLQAAEDGAGNEAHGLDAGAAKFDIDGLTTDDVAASGHDVGSGDAAGDGHLDTGVVGLNGVESAQGGLHGAAALVAVGVGGYVRPAPDADVRMGIHESGNDDLTGGVDDLRVGRQWRRGGRADGDDFALVDDENAVVDRRTVSGVNAGAAEDDRFRHRLLGSHGPAAVECDARKET